MATLNGPGGLLAKDEQDEDEDIEDIDDEEEEEDDQDEDGNDGDDDDDGNDGGDGDADPPPPGGAEHPEFADPLFFFDSTPVLSSVVTPGRLTPDKSFVMKVVGTEKVMPDGRNIDFWTFEDRLNRADEDVVLPGSPIRVSEGDIVHVQVKPSKRQHTIHLHGIEADTHNDGVGHLSFEVTSEYTYQFRAGAPFRAVDDPQPQTRGAGTYVYHCHVNTTLHFQMGMWGALIIDPASGPGTAFHGGPTYDTAAERVWACGDVDPVWHDLGHAAGMKGGDAGLNDFNPIYFHITGVFQAMSGGKTDPTALISDAAVATEGEVGGEPILIRYVNAAYARQRITFDGIADGSLDIDVIAADGRGFDNKAPNFAGPFSLNGPLESATGERYDFLVKPRRAGTSTVSIESLDWITGKRLGIVRTTITGT